MLALENLEKSSFMETCIQSLSYFENRQKHFQTEMLFLQCSAHKLIRQKYLLSKNWRQLNKKFSLLFENVILSDILSSRDTVRNMYVINFKNVTWIPYFCLTLYFFPDYGKQIRIKCLSVNIYVCIDACVCACDENGSKLVFKA